METPDHFSLPGGWSLRKLKLADRSEWAIQHIGMDWMRIWVGDFLQTGTDGWLDNEIRKFAEAMNAPLAAPDILAALKAVLFAFEDDGDHRGRPELDCVVRARAAIAKAESRDA